MSFTVMEAAVGSAAKATTRCMAVEESADVWEERC